MFLLPLWHVLLSQWMLQVEEYPDIAGTGGPPDSRALWLRWWQHLKRMNGQ